jgi:SAM-dependent methyltransferase
MTVFGDYSRYYDLLYRDKDYAGETEYIASMMRRFLPEARRVIELGAGTGRHAGLLSRKGYVVHGVESSSEMFAQARLLYAGDATLAFTHGDIRNVRLHATFDAAISLFHVVSYQTTNEDLLATFRTAREHLSVDGIFIFDCWYGPAVLTQRPSARTKRVENEEIEVTRMAEPELLPNNNLVDVHYHMFVRDKASNEVKELRETHRMRYLFQPEIELLLELAGFRLVHGEEWMTGKPVGTATWGACFLARACELCPREYR